MRKYHVILTRADRTYLQTLLKKGALRARIYQRTTALLELDRGQTLMAVAQTIRVSYPTVLSWREKDRACGLAALHDQRRWDGL